MANATAHSMSITLPHCWVCSARFTDVSPPGEENREEHHVIPRAYGGADGPTVSLCDKHHTALHKIAMCLKTDKPHFLFLQGEGPEEQRKLLWLATRVFNAEQLTRSDPNKRAMVLMSLDAKQQEMLKQLQTVYPQLRSREAVFNAALTALYSRHFITE